MCVAAPSLSVCALLHNTAEKEKSFRLSSQVLRPVSLPCRLKIWSYYVREALGEGPPYDGLSNELTFGASSNEEEATEVWCSTVVYILAVGGVVRH